MIVMGEAVGLRLARGNAHWAVQDLTLAGPTVLCS